MASHSDMMSQQGDVVETRGAGRNKKGGSRSNSREMLSTIENRLAKVELTVASMVNKVEDIESRMEELDYNREELNEELKEGLKKELTKEVHGVLNESIDMLTHRNEALEAMVKALRKEMEELKGELSAYKATIGGGMVAMTPRHRVEVPKPKEFRGTKAAKEVDNFLWGMEQYFHTTSITDDATKVSTASMYLVDFALLWWRRRCNDVRRGATAIRTWEAFQQEFRQQFYPEYALDEARGKLRRLTQRRGVREYCQEFSELMLMIPDMSDREALFSFMDGLKP